MPKIEQPIKFKVCGITKEEDALRAVYLGAWAVGFIFHKKSPRYISPSRAKKIVEALPPFVTPVGVFVNLKERAIKDICKFVGLSTVQLHGDEDPAFCRRLKGYKIIKAFRINDFIDTFRIEKYPVDAILLDTYSEEAEGGTGKPFSWNLLKKAVFSKPVILAGGLDGQNVRSALQIFRPYAVDVNSGVEKSPGIKDPRKLKHFVTAVQF